MPKLTVVETHPRAAARLAWTQQAALKLREQRRKRAKGLADRQRAIDDAVDLLQEHQVSMRPRFISIRTELVFDDRPLVDHQVDPDLRPRRGEPNPALVAHNRAALRDRPPLGRLAYRPGLAIPLELTALGIAAFRAPVGASPNFEGINTVGRVSWATLVGDRDIDAPSRARRHVIDALGRLANERLVQLPRRGRAHQPWEGWTLLREDGDGSHEYTVPLSGLSIPVDFWLQGWVAALTPSELVAYLMIRNHAETYPARHAADGVGVAPRVRRQQYGITDGVYATLNEVVEFGLLERVHGHGDRDPSAREVNRFRLREQGLRQPAYETISTVLTTLPTPARIDRYDGTASNLSTTLP